MDKALRYLVQGIHMGGSLLNHNVIIKHFMPSTLSTWSGGLSPTLLVISNITLPPASKSVKMV